MSGLEVIGGIASVVGIIQGCIEASIEANRALKLPTTFRTVARRLPFLRNTLNSCKNDLEPRKDDLPEDLCKALKDILDSTEQKANTLKKIYDEITPGDAAKWHERYKAFLKRAGKGSKVEELLASITGDVEVVVNDHAVNFAPASMSNELREIVKEMKSAEPSDQDGRTSQPAFHHSGRDQHNVVSYDESQPHIYHGAVTYTTYNGTK